MKEIDIDKIIKDNTTYDIINNVDCEQDINIHGVVKQYIREVLPEILKYVADNSSTIPYKYGDYDVVDREEIIGFEKEILKHLGV
jgi:hypothetical protein